VEFSVYIYLYILAFTYILKNYHALKNPQISL